jgi:hypothetical protein
VHRTRVAIVAAVVVHAAILALLPRSHPATAPATTEAWMSVDLEPSTNSGPSGGGAQTRTRGEAIAMTHGHGRSSRTETTTTTPEVSVLPETSEDTSTPPSQLSLDHGSIGLDGPGSYRFDALKAHGGLDGPSESAQIADNVNHAIMDPIRAHECETGTLADGPIVNELENTTRHYAGSPFEGRAVLAFRIDELGLVVSASVEDVSGDRLAWEEVAKKTFNALAQKRLVIPHGSKGVAMRVELTSKVALPSGARHALSVSSPAVDAVGHVLNGQFDRPMDTPAIVGGSFDVSDIGAHPMRVVGARVLSETAF